MWIFNKIKDTLVYVAGIVKRFVRKWSTNKNDHHTRYYQGDFEDDVYDVVMDEVMNKTTHNDRNELNPDESDDELDIGDKYFMKDNEIIITVFSNKRTVSIMSSIKTEEYGIITLYRSPKLLGCVTKATFGDERIRVTCSHVINLMSFEEATTFKNINPQIYCTHTSGINPPYRLIVNKGATIMWYTKRSDTFENILINCDVMTPINAIIKNKKKQQLATVAITIKFIREFDMLISGTCMKIGRLLFIPSVVIESPKTPETTVIAYAVLYHDYEFKVYNGEI